MSSIDQQVATQSTQSADQAADANDNKDKIQQLQLVVANLEDTVKSLSAQVNFLLSFLGVDATDMLVSLPQTQHQAANLNQSSAISKVCVSSRPTQQASTNEARSSGTNVSSELAGNAQDSHSYAAIASQVTTVSSEV